MARQFSILHLDDEPNSVDWIPGAINLKLHQNFPNGNVNIDPILGADGKTFESTVEIEDETVRVTYKNVVSAEEFLSEAHSTISFYVFDFKIGKKNGPAIYKDLEAKGHVGEHNVLFLTAYATDAVSILDWPADDDRIMTKPANHDDFMGFIFEKADLDPKPIAVDA